MSDALDICAAPPGICLLDDDGELSFAEAAHQAVARARRLRPGCPNVIVEHDMREATLELYASLLARAPFVPIHPKLPDDQQRQLRARVPKTLPSNVAMVVFTSGSSGDAKAVLLPRSAILASARGHGLIHAWRDDDRWLCALPLAHIAGLSILTRSLVARRPVSLLRQFSSPGFVERLHRDRCTITSLVPTMLSDLLESGFDPPSHLRLVLLGGAAVAPALLARAQAARFPVTMSYGMTESCAQIYSGDTLLPGAELRIGNTGAIELRGPMMFAGYLPPHRAALSDDGWFTTSDYGEYESGRLRVLGRRDDVIITGGENVAPELVEQQLLRLPGVVNCCVFGVPCPRYGQVVAAALQLHSPLPESDVRSLVAQANHQLAPHQRVRRFAQTVELPRTESGKVARRQCHHYFAGRLSDL